MRRQRAQPEGGAFKNQIMYKLNECVTTALFYSAWAAGPKVCLACVWCEEQFYTAGPVLRNGAGGLADGFPLILLLARVTYNQVQPLWINYLAIEFLLKLELYC